MLAEREAIEKERELELAERHEELEAELAELEAEGAKDSELKARQKQAEKDSPHHPRAVRGRARPAPARLRRVQGPLRPQDHRGRDAVARAHRPLRRLLRGRHGRRRHQARLIDRIDFDEEEIKLRAAIDPQEGSKPLSAQRKQKAIKRLKIVAAFNRRDEHGKRVNDPGP
jgi:DNA-directed RNA polymerase subunit beta'